MAAAKPIAIAASIAVACVAVAYGVGRMQGATKVDDAEKRLHAVESASASAAAGVHMQLEVERAKVARLEARRRLDMAKTALDEHNFGTAQEHLASAKAWLASAKGSDPELDKLSADIDALKLVATEDVGEQRAKVSALCKRLDELVPPGKP